MPPRTTTPVWIHRPSFVSIVSSTVEAFNREATGFLVGRPAYRKIHGRRRRLVLIEAAYPLITSRRAPSWVAPGNEAAYDRAVRVVHGVDVGLEVIGGFHSHPNGPMGLSDGDLGFVRQHARRVETRGWRLHGDRWLELVVAIRRRELSNGTHPDWYWQEAGDRMRARFWVPGGERYDLTVAGYWVDPDLLADANGDGMQEAVRATKVTMGL
ncbi:MAG: hypothetical protein ACRELA_23105 [Candidatus Rokuibacteriota bacterium]